MDENRFLLARYSTLIDQWNHHNSMQLQWPATVISATLVVISVVIPRQISIITNIDLWGYDASLALSSGIPLLLTGFGIIAILYMMGRGQKIMKMLEAEIDLTEIELGKVRRSFKQLNHPAGLSGRKLVRLYMIFLLALPIIFFGTCFLLGLLWGAIGSAVIAFTWFVMEQYDWISQRFRRLRQHLYAF